MNARLLLNVGLLAVFIALGWFAFELDAPAPAPPGVALTSLAVERIETIQIDRDGNTVARLQRSGDVWRVQRPISATADTFRVQALLGLARARSNVGFRAAGNDLTQYGLQPPRATVRFDSTVLHIGESDPVAGHRYVMSDDQVHLLEDNWFAQIFGDGMAWLDPQPLPAGATPLRIEWRADPRDHPGSTLLWQRLAGHWQRTPADPAANAQLSEQRGAALADAWRRARALSVRRRDPAIEWRGRVLVTFESPPQSAAVPAGETDRRTRQNPDLKPDGSETIVFDVAITDDAMFLARDDLGVQYRFLVRQGNALLGTPAAR